MPRTTVADIPRSGDIPPQPFLHDTRDQLDFGTHVITTLGLTLTFTDFSFSLFDFELLLVALPEDEDD